MFVLQDIRKAGAPSAASPTKGAASSAQLPILRFILPYFLPSAKQAVEISGICDFAVEWRTSLRYNEVTKAFSLVGLYIYNSSYTKEGCLFLSEKALYSIFHFMLKRGSGYEQTTLSKPQRL